MLTEQPFEVTLEIALPQVRSEEETRRISEDLQSEFATLLDNVRPGRAVAEELNLPTDVPVQFKIIGVSETSERARIRPKGAPVQVRASIHGGPDVVGDRREAIADSIGDALYRSLSEIQPSPELTRLVSPSAHESVRFNLVFEEEPVEAFSPPAVTQFCEVGQVYWGKGCSSWPW